MATSRRRNLHKILRPTHSFPQVGRQPNDIHHGVATSLKSGLGRHSSPLPPNRGPFLDNDPRGGIASPGARDGASRTTRGDHPRVITAYPVPVRKGPNPVGQNYPRSTRSHVWATVRIRLKN